MRRLAIYALLGLVLGMGSAAEAASCDDLVVDETNSVDIGKVTAAAKRAGDKGAKVRIRIYKNLGSHKKVEDLTTAVEAPCWRSGGNRLSNLAFFPIVLEFGDMQAATGSTITSQVSQQDATNMLIRHMKGPWQAYHRGEKGTLTQGVVNFLDDFGNQLKRPSGGGGNTTFVTNESGSYWWLFWTVVVICLLGGGVLYVRSRGDQGNIKAAQQRARGAFGDCTARVQAISNSKFVSERRFNIDAAEDSLPAGKAAELRADLEKMNGFASSARTAFTRFLPDQEKDPNPNGLSAAAYLSNESACAEIIVHFIEPAEELARKIDEATQAAHTAHAA